MTMQRHGMMIVRAELCERLASLRRSRNTSRELAAFRALAASYGMTPVVRLSEALERAMAEDRSAGSRHCPASLYYERLEDAIGCERLDEVASQALIASISVRLGA